MSKIKFLITLLTVTSLGVTAQNNYQPYSQMGIGQIEEGFYNRTSGLGETGIAYRSNRFLITNNPASFSALANQFFTMETAVRGTFISYAGVPVQPASTQSGDITFRKLVMGIKAAKHWGTSIGLVPFSTENYEFNVPYYIQGSNNAVSNHFYSYHGSVNKAYWANSVEFFHHLSLGVDAGYIFGDLNQKDILQSTGNGATYTSTSNDIFLQNLYMTYGLQLYGRISKHLDYVIGGVFSQKAALLASPNKAVLNADSITIQNFQTPDHYMYLPNSYGGGLSVSLNHKYTWVADYRYSDWNGVQKLNSYPGQDYAIVSSERGSLGFEVSKMKSLYNSRVELSYFQSGLYYSKSYLAVNGKQLNDMGISLGIGVNSLKSPLAYNIVFQYGVRGTTENNLIRENYMNLSFILNFGAVWYTKGR
ncbi:MAG TPA: hypothetical protein VHE54_19125, partial [Puia sp.]|nr:hypothetical protein [Puia sp.]